MAEPTPSTTMHHDAVSAPLTNSEVDSVTSEHLVTVGILGSGGNNSVVVANNLAMESRDQSSHKYADDVTKLGAIATPNSKEQVSQLCKICKEGKTGDEDPLICLGCSCPSDMRQAHRSCIKSHFGRGVKGGQQFCLLCRDVFKHHIYKVVGGTNSGDDDKRGRMKIQATQVGSKGKAIHPTPPPLSDHHVEMPPSLDNLNARSVGDKELHKLEMLDRINKCMLTLSALTIVATILFTMLFLAVIM